MSDMLDRAAETPFHYAGVMTELSQAFQHLLQASDWYEGLGGARDHPVEVQHLQERGNCRQAITRLVSAYKALDAREHELSVAISLRERVTLDATAPAIARALLDRQEPAPIVGVVKPDAE